MISETCVFEVMVAKYCDYLKESGRSYAEIQNIVSSVARMEVIDWDERGGGPDELYSKHIKVEVE